MAGCGTLTDSTSAVNNSPDFMSQDAGVGGSAEARVRQEGPLASHPSSPRFMLSTAASRGLKQPELSRIPRSSLPTTIPSAVRKRQASTFLSATKAKFSRQGSSKFSPAGEDMRAKSMSPISSGTFKLRKVSPIILFTDLH